MVREGTVPPTIFSVIRFRNRGNGESLISESGVFPEAGRMDIINIGNIQSSYRPGVRPVGCPTGPSKRIQLYTRESNTLAGRIIVTD